MTISESQSLYLYDNALFRPLHHFFLLQDPLRSFSKIDYNREGAKRNQTVWFNAVYLTREYGNLGK